MVVDGFEHVCLGTPVLLWDVSVDINCWQGGFISAIVNKWVVRSGSPIVMVISWLYYSIHTPTKPLKSGRALLLWYIGYPTKFRHPKTDVINRLGEMHTKKKLFPCTNRTDFLNYRTQKSSHVSIADPYLLWSQQSICYRTTLISENGNFSLLLWQEPTKALLTWTQTYIIYQ